MTVKVILQSIAKFSISSWINFVTGIVTVMVTTRLFNPDIYGLINIYNTASAVLVSIACLGFDSAFIRFYNEPPIGFTKESLMVQCLFISVISLFSITIIANVFFSSTISQGLFGENDTRLLMLLCINSLSLMILNRFFSQYYRLGNDAYNYTVQQILTQLTSKVFVILAAFISVDIFTVFFINTLGPFILMTIYSFKRRDVIFKNIILRLKGFKEVAIFAVYFCPQTVMITLNTFLIPWIISNRLDSYSVGIYASANFFVGAFSVLQSGFGNYWSAFMYAHYKDEQNIIIRAHDYVLIGIIVIFSVFILSQNVIYLLIGASYQASRSFFSLVLVDPLLLLLAETTYYGIMISKKNQESTIIYFFSIFFNILLTYSFLPILGITGAAVSLLISALLRFCLSTWRGQKYYKSIQSKKRTCLGVLCIISLAISNSFFWNEYLLEVLTVLVINMFVSFIYRKNIRDFLNLLRNHLKNEH